MKINLPANISVGDYHDFDTARDILQRVIPEIKVKEVALFDGDYQGIAYVGKLTDQNNKDLINLLKETEREANKIEESFDEI